MNLCSDLDEDSFKTNHHYKKRDETRLGIYKGICVQCSATSSGLVLLRSLFAGGRAATGWVLPFFRALARAARSASWASFHSASGPGAIKPALAMRLQQEIRRALRIRFSLMCATSLVRLENLVAQQGQKTDLPTKREEFDTLLCRTLMCVSRAF